MSDRERSEHGSVHQQIELLVTEVNRLRDQAVHQAQAYAQLEARLHQGQEHPRSEKLPNPEPFKGDRDHVEAFVAQLGSKFVADSHRFPSDAHKLGYAFALLSGEARNRIALFMNPDSANRFTKVDELFLMLKQSYGVTNKHEEALRKLNGLRQANKEFITYWSEFEALMVHCNYSDQGKKDMLLRGLSRELKNALTAQALIPESYSELVNLLRRMDSNIRLIASLTVTSSSGNLTSRSPATTTSAWTPRTQPRATAAADPMDLDSARVVERQRRRDTGSCFYCGEPGHLARNCPEKTKNKQSMSLNQQGDMPAESPEANESKNH
jgi:hypothetical protein